MLAIRFKPTDAVDFKRPLEHYIENVYQTDAAQFANDLNALNAMRRESCHLEIHENSLNNLVR